MENQNENNDKTLIHQEEENRQKRVVKVGGLNEKQKSLLGFAASGVGGVALGAVLMSFTNGLINGKSEAKPAAENEENVIEIPIYTSAPFSDSAHDFMSFSDAFAAARKDVGAGGFFEWRGNTYNTYHKEEWDAMSEIEKAKFFKSIDMNYSSSDISNLREIEEILDVEHRDIVEIKAANHEDIIIDESENYIDGGPSDEIVIIEDSLSSNENEPYDSDDEFRSGSDDI